MRRRSTMLIAPIFVALTSVVAGCMSGRVQQIYVLGDAADTPMDHQAAAGRTERQLELQLERVLVPDYLDTTDILSRVGEHELHASSSGRWGERLSLGIMHALWADLAIRLPQDRVTLARPAEKSARQILVNVDDVRCLAGRALRAGRKLDDTRHRSHGGPGRRQRNVHRAG